MADRTRIPHISCCAHRHRYVHFTHILVDVLLLLAPFGLFANLGWFAIPMTGLFTLFYRMHILSPPPTRDCPNRSCRTHSIGARINAMPPLTLPSSPYALVWTGGLLELSKSFLDPFGNRRVSATGLSADINVDCLLGEVNAGSLVWPQGAQRFPF